MIIKGRIIDCTGANPIEKGIIYIKNGKIKEIGKESEIDVNKKEKIIDVGEKTILPGLIDWHQHHVHSRPYEWYFDSPYGLAKSALLAMHNSVNWIKAGITTVRDYGGDLPGIIALRDEVNSGRIMGPRFVFVHGHDMGGTGPEKVKEKVLEVIEGGISDWIGLSVSGGFTSNQPRVMKRNFEEVSTAVEVAHAHGKKVDATLENAEACKICVEADVDCITHGMLIDEECLEMMRKKDMFWSPILLTRAVSCEMDLDIPDSDVNMSGLPKSKRLEWIQEMKDNLEVLKKHVKIGYEMGLKILSGSDIPPPRVEAVIIKNDTLAREIEMVRDWTGMSNMEAIMTATKYCGECLDMPIGTLEKGKIADLLVVDSDPLVNIRKALDPSSVCMTVKEGKILYTRE